jgi:type VI protein secretion system component VasK
MGTFDGLDDVLNIAKPSIPESEEIVKPPVIENKNDRVQDYEYTRGQLYSLIQKGQEAVEGALDVALNSDHPRAYEVAVNAMKQVSDMTDKLADLHKKMKELDEPTKGSAPTNVTNALFVGSTAELQKLLKQQKQINNTEEM